MLKNCDGNLYCIFDSDSRVLTLFFIIYKISDFAQIYFQNIQEKLKYLLQRNPKKLNYFVI